MSDRANIGCVGHQGMWQTPAVLAQMHMRMHMHMCMHMDMLRMFMHMCMDMSM